MIYSKYKLLFINMHFGFYKTSEYINRQEKTLEINSGWVNEVEILNGVKVQSKRKMYKMARP